MAARRRSTRRRSPSKSRRRAAPEEQMPSLVSEVMDELTAPDVPAQETAFQRAKRQMEERSAQMDARVEEQRRAQEEIDPRMLPKAVRRMTD